MHKDLIDSSIHKDLLNPEDFLNIEPIKDLINDWENHADRYKLEPSGELPCQKVQGVK